MKTLSRTVLALLTAVTLSIATLPAAAQQAATTTPAAPAAATPAQDSTALLKMVLENQKILENKIQDILRRLDSISQFLGDQRSSSFDSVDRRLRNIEDDIKDIKR